jgi:hypothetical protein
MPGPTNWFIWLILIPQLFVAVTTIAGMAGATGTALILAVPGDLKIWALVALAISLALVLMGRYKAIEWASIGMSLIIITALVFAAVRVFPEPTRLISGLMPQIPANTDYSELLPWLGFMMSGAAGMIWYSYWLSARGYGAASAHLDQDELEPTELEKDDDRKLCVLNDWLRLMTVSTLTAAVLVFILLVALIVLGTELLRPEGLIPEGEQVTEVLTRMLEENWGKTGRWLMIIAAFFAFWSTIIANLDGWARMLSQGTSMIAKQFQWKNHWQSSEIYRKIYLLGLMGVIPAVLFWVISEPMKLLGLAGIIEAIHIPLVIAGTLYLNHKYLPDSLKPSRAITVLMVVAGLFFVGFAGFFVFDLIGSDGE